MSFVSMRRSLVSFALTDNQYGVGSACLPLCCCSTYHLSLIITAKAEDAAASAAESDSEKCPWGPLGPGENPWKSVKTRENQ